MTAEVGVWESDKSNDLIETFEMRLLSEILDNQASTKDQRRISACYHLASTDLKDNNL